MGFQNLQPVRRGEPMNQSEGTEVEEPRRYGGSLCGNDYATKQIPLKANGGIKRFCQLLRCRRCPQEIESYRMLAVNMRLGLTVAPTLWASSSSMTRPVFIFCSRNTPRNMLNNGQAVSASTDRQLRSTSMSFPGEEVQSFRLQLAECLRLVLR